VLALALVLSLASAFAINWGYLAQHGVAQGLPPLTPRRPVRSLRLLFSNARWLAGFFGGIAGWVLYVAAVKLAPLSLVQAVSAGGIGLLALLIWRTTGTQLTRREWAGVGISVAGLLLLGLSLAGHASRESHSSWRLVATWILASIVVAGLLAGPASRFLAGGAGLGLAAGVLYAAGDVATKAAVGGGWRLAFVPAVLACHGLAFVSIQLAFQRGGALATAGMATLATNALPILAGMTLFHEPLPGGALGVVRLVAFALTVGGAALLARPEAGGSAAQPPSWQPRSVDANICS
jgi:drug/metabolite transporter (DMT)-like permease